MVFWYQNKKFFFAQLANRLTLTKKQYFYFLFFSRCKNLIIFFLIKYKYKKYY
ncbi:hypothetical protein AAJ76_570007133 [Vairimorpha ceranae]|uniref:Uncharacterized protein n=1 Tax=Vairimorpha ceranae TaxID=40302 RepID=A0A0F9WAG2_9MICR|nr:hypothetical protein AAJ76_570007133 [Vairimorpha ceranae]KKO74596.1 hypothetical protein AAJ76_570007133 [Vairimorpha ceranae]